VQVVVSVSYTGAAPLDPGANPLGAGATGAAPLETAPLGAGTTGTAPLGVAPLGAGTAGAASLGASPTGAGLTGEGRAGVCAGAAPLEGMAPGVVAEVTTGGMDGTTDEGAPLGFMLEGVAPPVDPGALAAVVVGTVLFPVADEVVVWGLFTPPLPTGHVKPPIEPFSTFCEGAAGWGAAGSAVAAVSPPTTAEAKGSALRIVFRWPP
jgi:hypothetical protein